MSDKGHLEARSRNTVTEDHYVSLHSDPTFDAAFNNLMGGQDEHRPWIGEPGKYYPGNEVGLGGEWLTAAEAAAEFNIAEREIRDRYRPLMPSGTVLPPMKEVAYPYDFEGEGYEWGSYEIPSWEPAKSPKGEPSHEWKKWNNYNRKVDHYTRAITTYWSADKDIFMGTPSDDLEPMMRVSAEDYETGYDKGLEPKPYQVEVAPELYHGGILREIRRRRVESRKVKPIPPRGAGGQFVKKSA